MTCDKNKNALLLLAASHVEPDAKLARHLERCLTCRRVLRSEQELFSRIDSTLRSQVNEELPPGFVARVRLQLSKEVTVRPGSNRVWHVAGAALALILFAALYPLLNVRQSDVDRNVQTPTIRVPQIARVTQLADGNADLRKGSRHHLKRPAVQSAVLRQPEVLVPPDEQQAFAQFVARVSRRDVMAQAVVTPAANKAVPRKVELPQVASIEVADLRWSRAGEEGWIDQTSSWK